MGQYTEISYTEFRSEDIETFLKWRHTDGQKAQEKMLNITITTMRLSLHISQNDDSHHHQSTNSKCWTGCEEKETLLHCWWECKLVPPLWRIVWRFSKKLKIELPYDPGIPLLGIYLEKIIIQRYRHSNVFSAGLFTIAKA